jgi:CheY-like chemotaxis protein
MRAKAAAYGERYRMTTSWHGAPDLVGTGGMQLEGTTILVVDDVDSVRQGLAELLRINGAKALEAVNGTAALSVMQQTPEVALVVTDIVMPDKEGIGLILELKRKYPATRIIAMSGGGRVDKLEYLDAALQFGANAVLTKPFDASALIDAIAAL